MSKQRWCVTETVQYFVTAETEEDAIEVIAESEDRDKFFSACVDRQAYAVREVTNEGR